MHYDNLVLNVYGDQTSLLNAIKSGQLNAANTADNNTLTEIQAAGYKVNPLQLNWAGLILFDRAGTTNPRSRTSASGRHSTTPSTPRRCCSQSARAMAS
ncbi:hypothetical protein AHiyo8_30830 [Arthrobacter sp. Hiyo8]|nr:hypothetical protein AHiyo8_30830 [Arthrobacter sp. Hiyo8]